MGRGPNLWVFIIGGLAAFVGVIAAITNPTENTVRSQMQSYMLREVASEGNPFVAVFGGAISNMVANSVSIERENYIFFSRFRVVTPDATAFGGGPSERYCLVGFFGVFARCEDTSVADSGIASSPQAETAIGLANPETTTQDDERSAREIHLANGFTDYGDEPLERPKGWLCDGARVTFASAGRGLVDQNGQPKGSEPGIDYMPFDVTIAGQRSRWLWGISMCGASCNEDNPATEYLIPLPDSQFSGSQFTVKFGVQFNGRQCEPVR